MVVLLEVSLQLASLFVSTGGPKAPRALGSDFRIACLGDSNTYGLWVEREEAWPSQLEALWNAVDDRAPIEVVNLGYPGTNSGQLVRDLPRILRSVAPDLVVVLVGVNDVWTRPVATSLGDDVPIWQRLRIWRLYRIAVTTLWPPELAVTTEEHTEDARRGTVRYGGETFRFGFERDESFAWEEIAPVLESNLRTLVTRSRAAGVDVVLLTYPSPGAGYVFASRIARRVASHLDTGLVDLYPPFAELCPEAQCPEHLFPDTHPRPDGYALMARAIADHLAASGVVP